MTALRSIFVYFSAQNISAFAQFNNVVLIPLILCYVSFELIYTELLFRRSWAQV